MPILKSRSFSRRVSRHFRPDSPTGVNGALLDARVMTVPLFIPANPWLVSVIGAGAQPQIGSIAATTNGSVDVIIDYGDGVTGTLTGASFVSNILETVTGPQGASGISIAVSHSGSLSGYLPALDIAGGRAGAGSVASLVDPNTGNPTVATWNILDSETPSNQNPQRITARFDVQFRGVPASSGTGAMPILNFASNQITVSLNWASPGLNIWDNTTPGGPTLVYSDPELTGQQTPSFAASYQVSHFVTLPAVETIDYFSQLRAGHLPGPLGPGEEAGIGIFDWQFKLENA